jgi:ribosomal small subunit protein bTHX
MGKGDKKSRKGKMNIGSYGKKRPARKQNKAALLRNSQ